MELPPGINHKPVLVEDGSITGKPSGALFPIGTTTNTYEFTDACGNKSSCTFTITVKKSIL
jgi:hypothetical protein